MPLPPSREDDLPPEIFGRIEHLPGNWSRHTLCPVCNDTIFRKCFEQAHIIHRVVCRNYWSPAVHDGCITCAGIKDEKHCLEWWRLIAEWRKWGLRSLAKEVRIRRHMQEDREQHEARMATFTRDYVVQFREIEERKAKDREQWHKRMLGYGDDCRRDGNVGMMDIDEDKKRKMGDEEVHNGLGKRLRVPHEGEQ
ncbi:hypothetical protein BJY04DRAFT_179081 [Aspergillus karnatakaensis]|uniref:uncharacterized protein n=1 Tax=Aspergillus karnatakaensis TaxID=1810916 RepID=UPI003CCD55E4